MRPKGTSVCLINTSIPYKYEMGEVEIIDFQAGLLSLAAVLKQQGHKVRLLDLAWLIRQGRLAVDESYHDRAASLITSQDSPILGFNTRCDTYPSVINIARRCKQLNPRSTIVFGGPQATFTDVQTLKAFPFVDVIVRGEGELTLSDLVCRIKDKGELVSVDGITYRRNGRVIRNRHRELIKDLDSLPMPAYQLMDEYVSDKTACRKHRAYISVGRGCPNKCVFCASSLMDRRYYRMKKPQVILEEINFLKKEYAVDRFNLGHDFLLVNRGIAEEICDCLIRGNAQIRWNCFSRVESIDRAFIKLLRKAGCEEISFGIETGSKRMQRIIGKNLKLELVTKALEICCKNRISTVTSFIVGFPEERPEDIDATIKLALECRRFPTNVLHHHLLSPMPGTAVCQQNLKRLVYLGHWSDMVSGTVAPLKENTDLIKKYPVIFSSFYVIRPRYLPLDLPHEVASEFFNVVIYYPKSFKGAAGRLGLSRLSLLKRWQSWSRAKGSKLRYFPEFIETMCARRKMRADRRLIQTAESEKKQLWRQANMMRYLRELKDSVALPGRK